MPTEPLFLPLVALGELDNGAKNWRGPPRAAACGRLLQIATLLSRDGATAEIYATAAVDLVDFGLGAPIDDGASRSRRSWAFRMILSYSRKAYSEPVLRQDTETFLRALENGLRVFGGVPLACTSI